MNRHRIRIDTDRVREVGLRLVHSGDELDIITSQLRLRWAGLVGGWEGQSRGEVEPRIAEALRRGGSLAASLRYLGRLAVSWASTFETTDFEGQRAWDSVKWPVGWVRGGAAVSGASMRIGFERLLSGLRERFSSWPLMTAVSEGLGRLISAGEGWLSERVAEVNGVVGTITAGLVGTLPFWEGSKIESESGSSVPTSIESGVVARKPLEAPALDLNRYREEWKQRKEDKNSVECVWFARARRLEIYERTEQPNPGEAELVRLGQDGPAERFIDIYGRRGPDHYRPGAEFVGKDLTDPSVPVRAGVAVVWKANPEGGLDAGHVAVIEKVGPDYIEVSEANWGKTLEEKQPGTRRLGPDEFSKLHFIL